MKKSLFLSVLMISSALLLSACTGGQSDIDGGVDGPRMEDPAMKQGDTSKTGVISEVGGKFLIKESGKTPEEIESYSVDLSQYVGRTVTVTGQFSGDTLFVGSISQ